jgi:hypothetical protein
MQKNRNKASLEPLNNLESEKVPQVSTLSGGAFSTFENASSRWQLSLNNHLVLKT